MASKRTVMPSGKKLERLINDYEKNPTKAQIRYNSSTHKVLLYAKFKKKAFTWDDLLAFHIANKAVKQNSGSFFRQLVSYGFLYHRIIDGVDYFQITPRGEHKLISLAESEQARRSKILQQSAVRGRATYLAKVGK